MKPLARLFKRRLLKRNSRRLLTLLLLLTAQVAASEPVENLFSKIMATELEGNERYYFYESNHSIETSGDKMKRVIAIVHGAERSNYSWRLIRDAAIDHDLNEESFIVAPQFLIDEDISYHQLDAAYLHWPNGWRQGHLSRDDGMGRISSFALVDQLVLRIVSQNPSVKDVVIMGHSAGGQFAQRFAAASQLEQRLLAEHPNLHVRYIVANPSSYVYMDEKRRVGDTFDQFAVPTASEIAACPDYDDYRYGLSGNFNRYLSSIGGKQQVLAQFPNRDVRYLYGAEDTDAASDSLDKSCEAMLQGRQRLERGVIFYHHIRSVFGVSVHESQLQALNSGLAHTSRNFTTDCGLFLIFDIGQCGAITPTNLQASVDSNSGVVTLSWQDRAQGENGYQIERSDDGGESFFPLETVSANTTTYVDSSAALSVRYDYRVKALTASGQSLSSNRVIVNESANPPTTNPPPSTNQPPAETSSGGGALNEFLILLLVLYGCFLSYPQKNSPDERDYG